MNKPKEVMEFWEAFCARMNLPVEFPYQVWYFGNTAELADELLQFVLIGKKRATASLPCEFEDKPEQKPVEGGYSVVTDFQGRPKCVLRTTEVQTISYNEVDADFAFDEGEGDQSLDYWRGVHWDYFSRQCTDLDIHPSETMSVLCERFELLYPAPDEE